MVLLPMAGEDNIVSRFLGCVNVDSHHADFPTRFDIRSVAKTRIIAAKSIGPKFLELAESQKPFTPDRKKATFGKPPFLRIVK
jgi:hypothetical protein